MSGEILGKIRGWLETEGYPLEMRVAKAFREAKFEVSSSEYYVDPEHQKVREIDVMASMGATINKVHFWILFVIECKSSKRSPWVCFSSGHDPEWDASLGFPARISTNEGKELLREIYADRELVSRGLFELPTSHAYAVVNALIGERTKEGNPKGRIDLPYAAIEGARSAANAIVSHYDKRQSHPNKVQVVCIAFPVVVVGAPLFRCTLGGKGEVEIEPTFYQTILRTGYDTYFSAIEIVADSYLAEFVREKTGLIGKFLEWLPGNIPKTMRILEVRNLTSDDE